MEYEFQDWHFQPESNYNKVRTIDMFKLIGGSSGHVHSTDVRMIGVEYCEVNIIVPLKRDVQLEKQAVAIRGRATVD